MKDASLVFVYQKEYLFFLGEASLIPNSGYEYSLGLFRQTGLKVETGQFQAHMQVQLQNDGPVTLMLDSADRHRPRR